MLRVLDDGVQLCDGFTRREWLRLGGLSCLGLSLPRLLAAAPRQAAPGTLATFGRAKACILLFLAGGPPQHETFDPKPDAPAEIRGPFHPIATNVPGIRFCELLPRTAHLADRLAVVRSVTTDENAHSASAYWMLTGYPSPLKGVDFAPRPDDWPCVASIVQALRPGGAPARAGRAPFGAVVLPEPIVNNPNILFPAQNGGFMGRGWDPQVFRCNPADPDFRIDSLALPGDVPPLRLRQRRSLLEQVNRHLDAAGRRGVTANHDRLTRQAFDVLTSEAARAAFDLRREKRQTRDRYGRHKFNQSVLLARRLVEAGVRLVQVNWPREPGDTSSGNPLWDTHTDNAGRLKDVLCPPFDVAFSALLEDLDERGLLAETLVAVMGEFGRTPKINARGGRDHWGHVFSVALAGAGISGGQVYGASDKNGGHPAANPVRPQDLTATLFHLLGINPDTEYRSPEGRPLRVSTGTVLDRLLGLEPATQARITPGGTVGPIPSFDRGPLANLSFTEGTVIKDTFRNPAFWVINPLWRPDRGDELSACAIEARGRHHAVLGYGLATGRGHGRVPQGTRVLLTQPIFNPRPGRYTFTVQASGGGNDPTRCARVWGGQCTCRLMVFRYTDAARSLDKIAELAGVPFDVSFTGEEPVPVRVSADVKDQEEGKQHLNFGIGVAVVVEKSAPGVLDLASAGQHQAFLQIGAAGLSYQP